MEQSSDAGTTEVAADVTLRGSLDSSLFDRSHISLGLHLERESLEYGLEALLHPSAAEKQESNYFKPPLKLLRDVGSDFDSIGLGLVTMEEAEYLFPM